DAAKAMIERAAPPPLPRVRAAPMPRRCEADLALPLSELARRREAVATRGFSARWAPGRLVSVLHDGVLMGVLLDRRLPGDVWQGWVAAGEPDWAGAFDVLLEPDDEPFEPMFGLVQTWNLLAIAPSPMLCARVVGEVSATRLAAIRAVHDEWAADLPLTIASEPGVIALRSAGDGAFTVLTGTPLARVDLRIGYQTLYRELAARVGRHLQPAATGPAPAGPFDAVRTAGDGGVGGGGGVGDSYSGDGGGAGWARVKQWFAADRFVRPAFAVLLLAVVVQQVGFGLYGGAVEDDAVRFRSVPQGGAAVGAPAGEATVPASPDLAVRWKPGVAWDDAARLLRTLPAEVVGGPDADGTWLLRTPDAAVARIVLRTSALVDSVVLAQGGTASSGSPPPSSPASSALK
ncbi:MAG: hypothetical protein V4636_20510, partial [Pseudomonadota bacterium]